MTSRRQICLRKIAAIQRNSASARFSRQRPLFPRACIDGSSIESVQCARLLGVTINVNLTWNDHVEELVKETSRKHYFLVQLKRAQVPFDDLVTYHRECIRFSLNYICMSSFPLCVIKALASRT